MRREDREPRHINLNFERMPIRKPHTHSFDLQSLALIKFIRELLDIWAYRANLSNELRRNICPLDGNPFSNINIVNISLLNQNELRQECFVIINRLIKYSGHLNLTLRSLLLDLKP